MSKEGHKSQDELNSNHSSGGSSFNNSEKNTCGNLGKFVLIDFKFNWKTFHFKNQDRLSRQKKIRSLLNIFYVNLKKHPQTPVTSTTALMSPTQFIQREHVLKYHNFILQIQ